MYVVLIFLAIFGPRLLTDWTYTELDQTAFLQGPSWSHKLGTTQSGRDVLAMSLQGLRVSMLISLVVGLGSTTIAAIVGSFSRLLRRMVRAHLALVRRPLARPARRS